jgi:succinoglycan biosynthesis transport protein ExoP
VQEDQEYRFEQQDERLDIKHYIYIIQRRLWYFVVTFMVVFLLALIHSLRQVPVYQAGSTLIIEPDYPQVVNFDEFSQVKASKEYYETQFNIIRSRKVLEKTLAILEPRAKKEYANLENPVEALRSRISVEPLKDTRLVKIYVSHTDPELAAIQVNRLGEAYIQHNLDDRKESSESAFTWLSEQLVILKKNVEESERKLLEYKEGEDIISLDKRQGLLEERISKTNEDYLREFSKRVELETMLQEIHKLEEDTEMSESLPRILDDSFIQQLKQEYSKTELELAKVSMKYKEKHPQVINLKSQLLNINQRLHAEIRKIAKSIEIEWRITKTKENTINNNMKALKRESMNLAKQSIEYGVLAREAESNRKLYEVLLHRLKETDISGNINYNNIRMIDKAQVPKSPVSPNRRRDVMLGMLLGLGLGIGICFLLDYFDDTIWKEEDIKRYLQQSLIGLVPKVEDFYGNDAGVIERAYREIRTVLNVYKIDHALKTLLLTSALKEEGKSTSVLSLGKSFSQLNLKVLLIDADLFKPTLSKQLGVIDHAGIYDYYFNGKAIEDIIVATDHEKLFVIPSGLIAPNPSEILSSEKIQHLIGQVKKEFDLILIDSPPITAALEIAALGNVVDGIALIVRANKTSIALTKKVLSSVQSMHGNIIGVILTWARQLNRYQDYYYYAYGHKEHEKKHKLLPFG